MRTRKKEETANDQLKYMLQLLNAILYVFFIIIISFLFCGGVCFFFFLGSQGKLQIMKFICADGYLVRYLVSKEKKKKKKNTLAKTLGPEKWIQCKC